jgi:alpha-L-fucosidase
VQTPSSVAKATFVVNPLIAPERSAEETERMMTRHRIQLTELLTHYGPIDCICLDEEFDAAVWPQMRETMFALRKLQPNVMFRCRGIGNYGDYYTPETFVPGAKANTDMPWMCIYPLVKTEGVWSYEPDATKYKDGAWIVTNLVDCVAKGGNFMVGFGPDRTGLFHPKAIEALQYTGAWLKTNGEAIFHTHPMAGDDWKDGDNLRLTRSDLGPITYAVAFQWPGDELVLHNIKLPAGATVKLLGDNQVLTWRQDPAQGIVLSLPARLQTPANRPSQSAFVFKLDGA